MESIKLRKVVFWFFLEKTDRSFSKFVRDIKDSPTKKISNVGYKIVVPRNYHNSKIIVFVIRVSYTRN